MQSPYTTARLKAVDPIVIRCSPVPARRIHRPAPRNLGGIEGERLSRCRGYDESYGLTKALLSLIALSGFLLAAAMLLGAM